MLVVVGELDAMTGVSVAERLAEVLSDARVAVVPGAGHFPWVDQPKAFSSTVATFLRD